MIGIYLIGTLIISSLLVVNRNRRVNYLLVGLFTVLQWILTLYEYNHLNKEELGYFIPDSLAILFLFALSVIIIHTRSISIEELKTILPVNSLQFFNGY